MALKALWNLNIQFLKTDGTINAGGKIIVTDHNDAESIPANYSDADGTTLNSSPIVLDALGRAICYIDDASTYDLYVKDANGATLWTVSEMTPGTETIVVRDGSFTVSSNDRSVAVTISVDANGVTNYDLSIHDEIDRATGAEKGLSDAIVAEKNRAEEAERTLSGSISNETKRATEAEKGISDAIDAEKKRAEEAERTLSESISNETKRATEAEKGLADSIEAEKKRAESAESALSKSIADETERAIAAEKASRTEIVAGDNITVTKTVGADGQDVYTIDGDNLVDDVRVNGASVVTDKVANIDVPVAGTASPLMDGKASVGNSPKYAREDHVHPSDTSREDKANKTTVVLGMSNSKYPTDKAVAEFVNSSIATNTANYISNNGEPFTSVEQLEAYSGPVTNNDYAFVTGTDSEGNTYYDRYKATVSGSSVTWALEYRLNNSSFTAAQWSAINSGITSVLVAKIHTHSNKDVLDGITSSDVANWNRKMDRQTVGNVSEPVYLENGMAKVATNVATTGNLDTKLNVDGSNATTDGVTAMMKKVSSGSGDLNYASFYFGDSNDDHKKIVRRPVSDLWNYIKDNLGTAGSKDRPVYFDGGVPKECDTVLPCSVINSGSETGYGVYVGGNSAVGSYTRCYCAFLLTATADPDIVAHTYIGTFTFRHGSFLHYELKCLTGTPNYPMRIAVAYNKNSDSTYNLGVYVIPADPTVNTYANYKLTRIASSSFTWACTAINASECAALDNDGAKPALKPIILTWDAAGSNVTKTGGTWIPTFDKATKINCRGIVDMSIQVDLSIIGQSTYIDTLASYDITLVNSSKTDILPASLHQAGRMPRQTRNTTGGGTVDISHTHRFVFPITSTTNLVDGYMPKITLPANYTLNSGAQVSIKALCRGIVLPYGADAPF